MFLRTSNKLSFYDHSIVNERKLENHMTSSVDAIMQRDYITSYPYHAQQILFFNHSSRGTTYWPAYIFILCYTVLLLQITTSHCYRKEV